MLTSTCSELEAAMGSAGARRPSGGIRPRGEATVVLTVGDTDVASWPLTGSVRPDLDVIDALARLVLAAHRLGGGIRLHAAGPELLALIDFVGLGELLVVDESSEEA
jgi:hypothetical protein